MGWLEHYREKATKEVQGSLFDPPDAADIVIDHTSGSFGVSMAIRWRAAQASKD